MRLGKGRRHKKTVNSGTMSDMGEREGGRKKSEMGVLPLRDFSPPPPSHDDHGLGQALDLTVPR